MYDNDKGKFIYLVSIESKYLFEDDPEEKKSIIMIVVVQKRSNL